MTDETEPHRTSLAVWDVPTTVVVGAPFTIRVGAKSSAESSLQGQRIELCDTAGAVIASGKLGSARWPGTSALYWTELSLPAPAQHGMATLSVRLVTAGLSPAHHDTCAGFAVMVTPPPEHTLTIRVVARETAAPIGAAEIRIGAYRATTADSGQAAVRLPAGRHELRVWKIGYEALPQLLDIADDGFIEVQAVTMPEENADRAWRG